jgi:hypothetical protein
MHHGSHRYESHGGLACAQSKHAYVSGRWIDTLRVYWTLHACEIMFFLVKLQSAECLLRRQDCMPTHDLERHQDHDQHPRDHAFGLTARGLLHLRKVWCRGKGSQDIDMPLSLDYFCVHTSEDTAKSSWRKSLRWAPRKYFHWRQTTAPKKKRKKKHSSVTVIVTRLRVTLTVRLTLIFIQSHSLRSSSESQHWLKSSTFGPSRLNVCKMSASMESEAWFKKL